METLDSETLGRAEAVLPVDLVGRGAAGVSVVQAQGRAVIRLWHEKQYHVQSVSCITEVVTVSCR